MTNISAWLLFKTFLHILTNLTTPFLTPLLITHNPWETHKSWMAVIKCVNIKEYPLEKCVLSFSLHRKQSLTEGIFFGCIWYFILYCLTYLFYFCALAYQRLATKFSHKLQRWISSDPFQKVFKPFGSHLFVTFLYLCKILRENFTSFFFIYLFIEGLR